MRNKALEGFILPMAKFTKEIFERHSAWNRYFQVRQKLKTRNLVKWQVKETNLITIA